MWVNSTPESKPASRKLNFDQLIFQVCHNRNSREIFDVASAKHHVMIIKQKDVQQRCALVIESVSLRNFP